MFHSVAHHDAVLPLRGCPCVRRNHHCGRVAICNAATTHQPAALTLLCFVLCASTWTPVHAAQPALSSSSDPSDDTLAAAHLMKLYSSTNGDSWTVGNPGCTTTVTPPPGVVPSSWGNRSVPVCSWFGVGCSSTTGHDVVNVVSLSNCSLSGTLPDVLLQLSTSLATTTVALSELRLPQNSIGGSLPLSYGSDGAATKLTVLDLRSNSLSGTLPDVYKLWVTVTWIGVSGNRISGTLPSSYASMALLSYFDVNTNRLTGTLPEQWSRIDGLTNLNVGSNSISGTLPLSFRSWSALDTFAVGDNRLSGTLPPEYSAWTHLTTFLVNVNSLTGTLPSSYSAWSTVTWIAVSENQLTGTLPASWSLCASLQHLHVFTNTISGVLPPSYGSLLSLSTFHAESNWLSGSIPVSYSSWRALSEFVVADNVLSGTLPPELSSWGDSLTVFTVSSNMFTGVLPPQYSAWAHITMFDVSSNSLSGTLPSDWSRWSSVSRLTVSINQLTGTLPAEWGGDSWPQLTSLSLSYNKLSSTIPDSYFRLTNNYTNLIDLQSNLLNGTFPLLRVVTYCTMLRWLYVSQNQFSGQVFEGITMRITPTPIEALLLDINRFTGTVPNGTILSTIFPNMSTFYLTTNIFSGPLPTAPIPHWQFLTDYRVDNNSFSGLIALDDEVAVAANGGTVRWLCHLTIFKMSYNPSVTGVFPRSLHACPNMTQFEASNVSFTASTIPTEYVAGWANVTQLVLRGANLIGTIPRAVSKWVNMTYLELSQNALTGDIDFVEGWTRLEYFRVASNFLTGTLPPCLSESLQLQQLYVQDNQFRGTLPVVYQAWSVLERLLVFNNSLSGTLPSEYARWGASVTQVNIANNHFKGILPSTWASWTNVASFIAYHNDLSGTLPTSWSSWVRVGTLMLDQNRLTGDLPPSWSNLASVRFLMMANNSLSGTLPSEWSRMKSIQFIGLQNNTQLTGGVPRTWSPFLLVSACGTALSSAKNGTCYPCLPDDIDLVALNNNPFIVFNYCHTLPPAPSPTNATPDTIPRLQTSSAATTQTVRDSLGVSIVGSAAAAAIAGDPSSAQMLITLLLSTCMCSDGSGGALSSSSDEDVFAAVVTSLTLSPFASLGPTAMAFGNAGLVCAAFVAQLLLVVFLGRRRGGGGGRRRDREIADVRPAAGRHDEGGATVLDLVASRWRALCVSPAAVAARFPNVAVVCGVFLVPGMVRGAVVVLGSAGSRGALEVAGAVVSVAVLCVFLVAVLEWLVYRTVVLEDVARSAGGAAGGGVLREDEPLHFEAYATPHPFTPPVPALVAAAAMSRGGAWVPAGKRNSFGRLRTRWLWLVRQPRLGLRAATTHCALGRCCRSALRCRTCRLLGVCT